VSKGEADGKTAQSARGAVLPGKFTASEVVVGKASVSLSAGFDFAQTSYANGWRSRTEGISGNVAVGSEEREASWEWWILARSNVATVTGSSGKSTLI